MTPAEQAVAVELVCHPNWRWAGGSLTDGNARVSSDGEGFAWLYEEKLQHVTIRSCNDPVPTMITRSFAAPDISDDATKGVMLALVRELWGDDGAYVIARREDLWWVYANRPLAGKAGTYIDVVGDGETEGIALARAIIEAP